MRAVRKPIICSLKTGAPYGSGSAFFHEQASPPAAHDERLLVSHHFSVGRTTLRVIYKIGLTLALLLPVAFDVQNKPSLCRDLGHRSDGV